MNPITLEELETMVQNSSSPSKETIFLISRRKKEVLANPGLNLSSIMDILANNIVSTQVFLLIIDIIDGFLKKCFFRLPVEDILIFFMQLPIEQLEDIACINKLSYVLAKNIKLMYIHHEQWMIQFNDDLETLADFDIQLYSDILHELCEPYQEISPEILLNLIKLFAQTYLDQLFRICINLILNQREGFLNLLANILNFGNKFRIQKQYLSNTLLENLQNPILLGLIMQMEKYVCVRTLVLFFQIYDFSAQENIQGQILDCVISIISNPSYFTDTKTVFEVGKILFLLKVDNNQETIPILLDILYKSILQLQNQNPEIFFIHLNNFSKFLLNVVRYYDIRQTALNIASIILELPDKIANKCSEFLDETFESFSIIFMLIQDSLPQILQNLTEKIFQIFGSQINQKNLSQISIILLIIQSIFTSIKKYTDKTPIILSIHIFIEIIDNSQEKITEFAQINDNFEYILIESMIAYVSFYFSQGNFNLIKNEPEITQEVIAAKIFNRYINDISFGLFKTEIKKAIFNFINCHDAMDHLCKTSYPYDFINTFKDLPPKKIIYTALMQIMFQNSNTKTEFFHIIQAEIQGNADIDRFKFILHMMTGFFCGLLSVEQWKQLYTFSIDNLVTSFEQISKSDEYCILLDFLHTMTKNFPKSNPFFEHRKPEYTFIKTMFSLLTNILNQISKNLQKIEIDESIFKYNVSASVMTSNNDTMVEHMMSDTDKYWIQFSEVLEIINSIISVPCINFGIMKLYNDMSIIYFLQIVMKSLSATSKISLLSFPRLLHSIASFLSYIVPYYSKEIFMSDIYPEIIYFLRILFLSNETTDIDISCSILYQLAPLEYSNVRQHLVLAINSVVNGKMSELLGKFICLVVDNDREFFLQVIQSIASDFPEYSQNIIQTLSHFLENDSPTRRLRHFYNDVPSLCILIEEAPSLYDYFNSF